MSRLEEKVQDGRFVRKSQEIEIELTRQAAIDLKISAAARNCSEMQFLRHLVTKAMAHQRGIAY
jgi:hypothetical protein